MAFRLPMFRHAKYFQTVNIVEQISTKESRVLICRRWASKQTTIRSMRHQDKKSFSEKGYILLVIPAAAFCLGCWQVKRRSWKLNLLADLESRTSAEPIPFPSQDLNQIKDLEYRKVTVSGTFDHSKELHMMPRALVQSENKPSSGLITHGKNNMGACVITPFKLSDRNLTILVNRGWVPKDKIDQRTRQEGQVEGEVSLVGIVRHTEKRPQFGAKNNPQKNHWFNRDLEAMCENLGADPYFVDAVWETTVPGGPIGGQTRVTLRNEHFSYILTWYSLCAITTAMWYRRYWKR